jgi:zinc protease
MKNKTVGNALAAVTALVVVLSGAGSQAAERKASLAPNAWAQAVSDLKPDPQIRFGRLPNGMTYALMHNATPSGQASLRLRFAAGAVMESDAQQGLAHFLEHMAFNGSTHVPTGEMAKILERHGLAFGADTNASTGSTETMYQLDLPKTDADTVDTSLTLLREIAGELQIPQAAVDRERGVVLSEERLRDTPGYRASTASLRFLLPGQLASERLPIGKIEVVSTASRAAIKAFYDRYYRPERASLVAVGDFDVDAMEARIKSRFGGWTNTHPAGPEPRLGVPAKRVSETRLVVEPGAPLGIQMNWVAAPDLAPETFAKDKKDLLEGLALAVLNRRLERLTRSASPPFISASAYSTDLYHSAKVVGLQVSAEPGAWNTALAAAAHEQKRLVDYGVLKGELAREIEDSRASFRQAVAEGATRRTPRLANMLVQALDERSVTQSPAQELAEFEQLVKLITPADVSATGRRLFSGSGPLLFVNSPQPIEGGQSAVAVALRQARSQPVSAPILVADKTWPYAQFGPPGKVVERREVAEVGATMVRFANGVRLTVKPTKFRQSQVSVQVRFGDGRLDLPKTAPTAIWAGSAFIEGGLKQLTAEDIDQVLTSKIIGARFGVDDDAFVLGGGTKSADLDTELQLLTAYVAEPGFRPEAFERMRTYGLTLDSQVEATASGVLGRDLGQLLHNGDPRWSGVPSPDIIAASNPGDLKAMLASSLADGPIEVIIVGDIDVKRAIATTAATFGALQRTAETSAPTADERKVAFPAPTAKPIVETHKGRADQAMAVSAWPTTDFYADTKEARTLSVLAQVMQMRMTDDLRVADGATYSPGASLDTSQTYPGYGYLIANVEIPPSKLPIFFDEVHKLAQDLRTKEVSPDELTRATLPRIEQVKRARETNDYWVGVLAGAQTDPRRLDAVRTQITQLQQITRADLLKAAQKYLIPGKAWELEVLPETAMAAK